MKKLILALITALALTGCASTEYAQYTSTQQAIASSRAQADTARYQALASIAKDGTDSAKVAAVMALALGGNTQSIQQVSAPQPNQVLQWASILVPAVTQAYSIAKNADVAINASNNAMLTSSATTNAFVGIAGKIQAPVVAATVLPQANVSTVTTNTTTDSHNTSSTVGDSMSGTGVLGTGTYSTQANPVSTTTTTSTTTPTPIVVPDVIQVTPIVVPDVIQVTPIVP